jgi:hypothetical protein
MIVDKPIHARALYALLDVEKLIGLFSVFCNAISTILNVNKIQSESSEALGRKVNAFSRAIS